jgi:hypothetical protein
VGLFALCVGLCEVANPKCANVGRLKLFFKMCGGEIFKTNALALVSAKWSGRCRVTAKLSTEFLSSENYLVVKSLVVLLSVLIVALLSSSLAYNGFAARRQWRVRSLQYKFSEKILRRVKLN